MLKNRPEVILMVYGKGGHAAQMTRFINGAPEELKSIPFIALTDVETKDNNFIRQFYCVEARDKFSHFKNIIIFILYFFWSLAQITRIMINYRVIAMISTGPGVAVVPGIICRLFNIKVVYFESWSRVFTPSLAGKVMYHIANLFFIQHESLKKHYPKSRFFGRL
ncbi:PssD/Cps14F family polysaccharide biosynthesis glycosyltransferase [Thalassotalea sp. G2M2-11]|uniref:PssD/Cps14F family polysaccharide biosynthesis glycosyltransferase n=1 Tax=Thalassotalea sp. G2M2-11 TaxID=2787627 RepID=UPI0019D1C65A|nr:PssD/Cps14F family polysaccharide biosynthesis glycosyltransferase [Thalassotalea sp. G2M2-11]